jgi:hypothetical protein
MTPTRTIGDRVRCNLSKSLRDEGAEIYSVCVSFRYPKSGNFHNPTPILTYVAFVNGRQVCSVSKLSAAKEVIRLIVVDGVPLDYC